MKNLNRPAVTPPLDILQARFGLRVAARLNEQAEQTPHDITERLRVARDQALARARHARAASVTPVTAPSIVTTGRGSAVLALGGGGTPWWLRFASVMPLVVLVGGLMLIQQVHDRAQISAAADVDAQLLSDDLPPAAYKDPGFVEFLKTSQEEE